MTRRKTRKKSRTAADVPDYLDGAKLSRYLARAGKGSRRACDRLIEDGLVSINRSVVRNPAHRLQAGDRVKYLDETVTLPLHFVAILNKPVGYETTMTNKHGSRTILELLHEIPSGAAPAGRLDIRTGGLLVLSNDGDLLYRLTHPRWRVEREYMLIMSRNPSEKALARLKHGVMIEPGVFSKPSEILICGSKRLRLVLTTGRNREVRKLAKACRLYLSGLERIRYGPVHTGSLQRGSWRFLNDSETAELYKCVGLTPLETG